jgi:hypothetical protein
MCAGYGVFGILGGLSDGSATVVGFGAGFFVFAIG